MKIPKVKFDPVWLAIPAILTLWYSWTSVEYAVDFWHCLVAGRSIWLSGTPLVCDTSTFTIAGNPVLEQAWLGRLSLYGLFNLGGYDLAQFAAGLLYAAALLLTTFLAWRRSGNIRVAAGLGIAVFILAMSNLTVRTQAVSVPLFAVELYVLWRWPGRKWTIGVVALVEIVWANTHGAFPLGIVLPGTFLLAAGWERWRKDGYRGLPADPVVGCYLACVLVGLAAMFCNPRPGSTLDYVAGVASKSSEREIGEWAATSSGSFTGAAFFASILLVLIVLAISDRRLKPIELLLLVSFAALGHQAQRMVIWWAMVMAPVIAPRIAGLLETWRGRAVEEDRSAATVFIVLALVGMTALCTPWTRRFNPLLPPAKRQAVADDEPCRVVDFLKREGLQGRAFCTMEWGAYLSWHLDPALKVFIDSRLDNFPDEVWTAYVDAGTVRENWQEILDEYQVDLVVWNRQMSDALPGVLERSEHWKSAYEDKLGVVYVRAALYRSRSRMTRLTPSRRRRLE